MDWEELRAPIGCPRVAVIGGLLMSPFLVARFHGHFQGPLEMLLLLLFLHSLKLNLRLPSTLIKLSLRPGRCPMVATLGPGPAEAHYGCRLGHHYKRIRVTAIMITAAGGSLSRRGHSQVGYLHRPADQLESQNIGLRRKFWSGSLRDLVATSICTRKCFRTPNFTPRSSRMALKERVGIWSISTKPWLGCAE